MLSDLVYIKLVYREKFFSEGGFTIYPVIVSQIYEAIINKKTGRTYFIFIKEQHQIVEKIYNQSLLQTFGRI